MWCLTPTACCRRWPVAAQATYIVSNDTHYDVLKEISFPKILVLKLKTFIEKLTASKE